MKRTDTPKRLSGGRANRVGPRLQQMFEAPNGSGVWASERAVVLKLARPAGAARFPSLFSALYFALSLAIILIYGSTISDYPVLKAI